MPELTINVTQAVLSRILAALGHDGEPVSAFILDDLRRYYKRRIHQHECDFAIESFAESFVDPEGGIT